MNIKLVPVKEEHCDLLFKWVNDETVRKNSFNTNEIDYEQHKKWFENKIKSSNTFIYICYIDKKIPIGQIRVDMEDGIGFIDYSIDKKYRGQGYGTKLLKEIVNKFKNEVRNIRRLVGKVKIENIPSQKAFAKAGYRHEKKNDYIEYYIDL
ncbi:GNAT family N-acetyltransferase [Caloranaerobacter sp. DY30410]|uniref:GNAT family N-acetyltransferase n=1 Tax=Caloranaerobacter sp. DY30410 TaxID=3238305 RepID=UPI003CFC08E6